MKIDVTLANKTVTDNELVAVQFKISFKDRKHSMHYNRLGMPYN